MRIRIRKIEKQHVLVYDSFIRYQCANASIARSIVDLGARKALNRILTRPTTEVRAAVDADNTDKIYGLAVYDPSLKCLSWVFTKKEHRQYGVMKALLSDVLEAKAWWIGRGAEYVARATKLTYEPLLLLSL